MKAARIVWVTCICLLILLEGISEVRVTASVAANQTSELFRQLVFKLLKVYLGAQTLWGDGGYSHDDMAQAAKLAGYDAVFFNDNALLFGTVGQLADPSFENVSAAGTLTKWVNATIPPPDYAEETQSKIEAFSIPNIPPNSTFSLAKQRVLSGQHSLHMMIQSPSSSGKGWGTKGVARIQAVYPNSYSLEQSQFPPTPPLLINNLVASVNVFADSVGYAGATYGPRAPTAHNFTDNGWFYVRFFLTTAAHGLPSSGVKLVITMVYSDHPVDEFLRRSRRQLNETNSKVIYLGVPPLKRWVNLNFNVTGLARQLWNQTIVEDWRLGTVELGVFSRNNGAIDVYVDDVSLTARGFSPLQYFRDVIQERLSTSDFRIYSGYRIYIPRLPTPYILGTTYLNPNRTYSLTDPSYWKTLEDEASHDEGVVILGPIATRALSDYIVAYKALGVRTMDTTSFLSTATAGQLLDENIPMSFAGVYPAISPEDFNSTWSARVLAENNSEAAILQAISERRAYVAISNFTGSFSFDAYGFPMVRSPIYVPSDENASFQVSFTGLKPGNLRVYAGHRLIFLANHNGSFSSKLSFAMEKQETSFFPTVTGENDSFAIVGNPLDFIGTSMIPKSALRFDNPDWSLGSSDWSAAQTHQRLRLVISGPIGTTSILYLFSPEWRPDSASGSKVARFISINNATFNPFRFYDTSTSTFILPLNSTGQPIEVVFNFDIPIGTYLPQVFSSVVVLLLIVVAPFAIAGLIISRSLSRRTAKRRKV